MLGSRPMLLAGSSTHIPLNLCAALEMVSEDIDEAFIEDDTSSCGPSTPALAFFSEVSPTSLERRFGDGSLVVVRSLSCPVFGSTEFVLDLLITAYMTTLTPMAVARTAELPRMTLRFITKPMICVSSTLCGVEVAAKSRKHRFPKAGLSDLLFQQLLLSFFLLQLLRLPFVNSRERSDLPKRVSHPCRQRLCIGFVFLCA